MNIVLLSGGSGKRLWPLSNSVRSKQFIKIFKKADGRYESMVQRVYRQIKNVDEEATVTIATSKSQVPSIYNQLGDGVGISVEPQRKDTFPAIVLATAYLHDIQGVDEKEPMVICPVDPYVDEAYFRVLKEMSEQVEKDEAKLVLMGINPAYPSDKYGYIIPRYGTNFVNYFIEKPTREEAVDYIASGALWNGGVFAYRLKYILDKSEELTGLRRYSDLLEHYATLPKISFDYAVAEKESSIQFVPFDGEWKDVGTWNTITEVMSENVFGYGVMDNACHNVHILNELDIPVLVMGIQDAVVAAGPDGILVSDKMQSGLIKQYVDQVDTIPHFADKSWGEYRILGLDKDYLTAQITMNPGTAMSYHNHQNREEKWTIVKGSGYAILDGITTEVSEGDVISIPKGCKHTLKAKTDLKVIEVQIGEDISVHDKTKFTLDLNDE